MIEFIYYLVVLVIGIVMMFATVSGSSDDKNLYFKVFVNILSLFIAGYSLISLIEISFLN
jgi:hypothetical protein